MKIDLIFLCIILFVIYHVYMSNKIESMADVSTDITEAIKQVYLADVEAIRNLSNVATQLQADGLTIPGDLTIKGKLNILPKGTIVAFNSDKAPEGWALCDGQNGTPDLRGRFIRMQSDSLGGFNEWGGKIIDGNVIAYDKTIGGNSRDDQKSWILNHRFGDKAGTDHQTLHLNEMPVHSHGMDEAGNHTHLLPRGDQNWNSGSGNTIWGGTWSSQTGAAGNHKHNIQNTGGSWGHNNQPPYYVLSYIMKL